jgi:hypothetical protein
LLRLLGNISLTGLALTGLSGVALAERVEPDTSTASYQKGSNDRDAWEAWFSSLSGDVLAGASYWAENRSHNPISCTQMAAQSKASYVWLAACNEAQRRLASVDYYRKTDAQYWNGWNKKIAFAPGIPGVPPVQPYYPPIQPGSAPPPYTLTNTNSAIPDYCDDTDVTNDVPGLVEHARHDGSLKVLKLYDYRRNKDANQPAPCVVSMIGNDGLYQVFYGQRVLQGDTYIYVRVIRVGGIDE